MYYRTTIETSEMLTMSLRQILSKITSSYAAARSEPYGGHPLADYIRNRVKNDLKKALHQKGLIYDVDSGVGITQWATCPWIAVLDGRITSTAKRGVYVVYLFNGRDKKVVLSLNQGVSALQDEKVEGYREILKERARVMRCVLDNFINNRTVHKINLGWRGGLPKLYEMSHAFGFEYQASDMPSDDDLWEDLQYMLRAYSSFVEQGGFDSPEDLEEAASHNQADKQSVIIEKLRRKMHRAIERRSGVAEKVKKALGCKCQVCGKRMEEVYGDIGKGYIEVHHKRPLSTLDEDVQVEFDAKQDYAVLCANCHRMIHRLPDPSNVELLKNMIKLAKQSS
jgi:5-methylcytosine-specific restriction protein A